LNTLLEMEFKISEELNVPIDFDDKDFLQFVWIYNKVIRRIQQRNQERERMEIERQNRKSQGGFRK